MAIASTALLLVGAASSATVDLGCSGVDNWAAGSAYAQLKNAGLVAPETVDFPQIQVTLLAQHFVLLQLTVCRNVGQVADFNHIKKPEQSRLTTHEFQKIYLDAFCCIAVL